jgi:hypothetical protein
MTSHDIPTFLAVLACVATVLTLVAFIAGSSTSCQALAEGEGKMTMPRPQQWTEAEMHRLRMLVKRKVSADSIAKLLGRYVGSVKIKARELNLILSRRLKAKGK